MPKKSQFKSMFGEMEEINEEIINTKNRDDVNKSSDSDLSNDDEHNEHSEMASEEHHDEMVLDKYIIKKTPKNSKTKAKRTNLRLSPKNSYLLRLVSLKSGVTINDYADYILTQYFDGLYVNPKDYEAYEDGK